MKQEHTDEGTPQMTDHITRVRDWLTNNDDAAADVSASDVLRLLHAYDQQRALIETLANAPITLAYSQGSDTPVVQVRVQRDAYERILAIHDQGGT